MTFVLELQWSIMKNRCLVDEIVKFVMTRSDVELAGLTVSDLARGLDVDRFKLTREFKTSHAMKMDAYILREKIIRSAYRLGSDPDFTVKDAAERMGFCNEQYFSKVFKDFFGISPCRYKEYKELRSGVKDRRTVRANRSTASGKGKNNGAHPERRKNSPDQRKNPVAENRQTDNRENPGPVNIQNLLKHMKDDES
jgi:AraC-like DNA-binding protein